MNNYEYIVASLPVLRPDDRGSDSLDAAGLIEEIRAQLSGRDAAALDRLLDGYDADKLDEAFYRDVLHHGSRFIREWFGFDLDLRNTTVSFLNTQLERPAGQDLLLLPEREEVEFPEEEKARDILHGTDILARERGLDELRWQKIDEITWMDYFDLDAILGYVARLKIIDRWLQLDPDSGRALFRRLVEQIRSTYDNKKNNDTI